MTTDFIRKQVILEKEQSLQLKRMATDEGLSFSELVRNLLTSQLQARVYKGMELAADSLYTDYSAKSDLTDMTLLDGEDIIDG